MIAQRIRIKAAAVPSVLPMLSAWALEDCAFAALLGAAVGGKTLLCSDAGH